jgi:hypothetical protein
MDKLEESVLDCIDRGLDSVGENTKQVFYWYMKNNMKLERIEIVRKPEEFMAALNSMFGKGSEVLGARILNEIRVSFREEEDQSGMSNLENALNHFRTKIRGERAD